MLRGFANGLHELKCQLRICWWIEYFWMGYDTQKTVKDQICHSEGLRTAQPRDGSLTTGSLVGYLGNG